MSTRGCIYCQKSLEGLHKNAGYCDDECRKAEYAKRAREARKHADENRQKEIQSKCDRTVFVWPYTYATADDVSAAQMCPLR